MRVKTLILIMILGMLLIPSCICDVSEATPTVTYGSDSVGGRLITFDPNGGNGGYNQYVISENKVYFPTEYGDNDNRQAYRNGYVLMGWTGEDGKTYYPGLSYEPTSSRYNALWDDIRYECCSRIQGSSNVRMADAQHIVVSQNGSIPLDTSNDYGATIVIKNCASQPLLRYTLTVTYNGHTTTSTYESINGTVSSDWLTMTLKGGSFSFSGTTDKVGVHEITLRVQTKKMGGSYGDLDDAKNVWFVSVCDKDTDPSNIRHVYYNGTDVARGPYGTAIQLPNADVYNKRQNGWSMMVDGSPVTYPLGGSYTIKDKDITLVASEYTDSDLSSGAIGIIAYNSNGGYYEGSFAGLVLSDGCATLKDGSIVKKSGKVFIGWNLTGSPSDAIYPAGYSFRANSEYTELVAVWGTSSSKVDVDFVNPSNGTQNFTLSLTPNHEYVLPMNNIYAPSGYTFKGWSEDRYDVGSGTAIAVNSVHISSNKTYYAIFEKGTGGVVTTYTVTYSDDSGTPRIAEITAGGKAPKFIASQSNGKAFDCWRLSNGQEWDFSRPITQDIDLIANYLPIFHLEIDGTTVKVILDCDSSKTRVSFSDGFSDGLVHKVSPNTNGHVTVTVDTVNGQYTAVYSYSVGSDVDVGDDDDNKDSEKKNDDLTYWLVGAFLVILAVLLIGRMYL